MKKEFLPQAKCFFKISDEEIIPLEEYDGDLHMLYVEWQRRVINKYLEDYEMKAEIITE